jgi:hypothetical protein
VDVRSGPKRKKKGKRRRGRGKEGNKKKRAVGEDWVV